MITVDITGMGGGYEHTAQLMLKNGIEWLEKYPEKAKLISYKTYQNIYGIASAESDAAKSMDKAIMRDIEDATGAMHQCVVGHLLFIAKNGYTKWLKEFPDDRAYDWDPMDSKTCPKTELSEKMESANNKAGT